MALIDWTSDLNTKIGSIDEQHHRLVFLINNLHEAMKTGKGREALGKILDEMIEYAKTHFATEERLMTAHSYPGYALHKKEHDEFKQKATKLDQDFKSGKQLITVEVMQFLKNWLTLHIKGTDQKYGPFLLARGVS
ncbi:MAG: bacteriohemerythrin [Nitrospiraceae bacterium]|nr:bacteriohemerythrin [Nitrospiraceae bacterium]